MKTLRNTFYLIQHLGLNWFLFRSSYELRRRTGVLNRRFPARSWDALSLSHWVKRGIPTAPNVYLAYRHRESPARFFFESKAQSRYRDSILAVQGETHRKLLAEVDKLKAGMLKYFERQEGFVGFPPQWHRNPFNGCQANADSHWADIPDFSDIGDIKWIWEPSRFAIAYKLVRAYWMTGDEIYPELFWELVENWRVVNPPQRGPNWKCGQEAAFRVMAWCFALYGFANSTPSTPERIQMLVTMIAVHTERIEGNIGYALSQKNNHGVSEALGLYTVGLLFPEFKRTEHWCSLGKELLIREGMRQIYNDGAYVQHSMNYHRLMFHDYLWAIRLGQLNGDVFPESLLDRLRVSLNFLYQMVDAQSGHVPNYGANDGALILPLNNCDYLDYRPVLQAMSVLLNNERLFEHGPWDEDLVWLFGPEALQTPLRHEPLQSTPFNDGGYYTLRGQNSWGMIRCHTYRERPSHADMLHFDLWYNGQNVLRDAGTFQYYCEPPWDHYFKSTAAHNTVVVDGKDQMEKGSRFLWFHWTKSQLRHNEHLPLIDSDYWEGEHYSYRHRKSGVVHRRAVVRRGDKWIIIDDILGNGKHSVTLRWHLANSAWENVAHGTFSARDLTAYLSIRIFPEPKMSSELLFGQESPEPEGWESLYYGERQPIPVVKCSVISSALPLRFVTTLHLGKIATWHVCPSQIFVADEGWCCHLSPPAIESKRIAILS